MSDREVGKSAERVAPMPVKSKRRYQPPRLIEYGSAAKLTQGTLTRNSDGVMGGFSMQMLM